mgnify:CR=1 FL=1
MALILLTGHSMVVLVALTVLAVPAVPAIDRGHEEDRKVLEAREARPGDFICGRASRHEPAPLRG